MQAHLEKLQLYLQTNEKIIQRIAIVLIVVVSVLIGSVYFIHPANQSQEKKKEFKTVQVMQVKENTPTPSPTIAPTLTPTPTPPTSLPTKLLFGIGPEADQALNTRLVQEANIKMLTSWYNGPNDLSWIINWRHDLVPQSYAKGYTLHLITFTDHPEGEIQTKYGPACGREYPVSARFVDDMRQLAETFNGSGKLYVTLFTEFQTYPCEDNTWAGSENYYNALKDNYRAAKSVFRQHAPNSKVAISWGGWQSRWDDPAKGAGRSLFPHFSDIMTESDFTAFQAMESGSNVDDVRNMTRILGQYKRPVMLSHYLPDSQSKAVYDADTQAMFQDVYMKEVMANGLFAFSFMGPDVLSNEGTFQFVKQAIVKYGK